jgi:hypothetical protein
MRVHQAAEPERAAAGVFFKPGLFLLSQETVITVKTIHEFNRVSNRDSASTQALSKHAWHKIQWMPDVQDQLQGAVLPVPANTIHRRREGEVSPR